MLWIAVPLAAFVSTVQGRIGYWDTAEMQTVPWIFGIPHPTGFPAFVILAGAFAHVVALGPVSWRIAFFCALLMTGCVALVYGIVVSVTGDRLSAICASWLLAFGTFFWWYGVRAEIHTMAAFFAALALYFALRGYYERQTRWFRACAAAFGMGLATHPIVMFLAPSLLLLAAARARLFSLRALAIVALLAAAPLCLYAYLPLRSHAVTAQRLDPAARLGKPPGGAFWNTDNPQTASGFLRLVTGADFHASRSVLRVADVPRYVNKLQIFGWTMYREFSPVGIIAGILCLAFLLRRDPVAAIALLSAIALPAAFALSYPPVVEIERYFFIPMIALAAAIGLGIASIAQRYRNLLRIPVAAAALALLGVNYPGAHLRSVNGSEGLIARVRDLTPPRAVLIADWTHGTPLAYAAYVDHTMGARAIDIAWLDQDLPYIRRWIRVRPVYYVGRPILHRSIRLCRISGGYPIFAVRLEPGHCT